MKETKVDPKIDKTEMTKSKYLKDPAHELEELRKAQQPRQKEDIT